MPQVIPAVIGLAAQSYAAAAGYTAFQAALIGLAAATVSGFVLSGVLGGKKKKPQLSVGSSDRSEMIRQTDAPWYYVYGRQKKSGAMGFHHTSADNEYFYMAVVMAPHQIEEFERIYLGEDELILVTDTDYTTTGISHYKVDSGKYKDHVWIDLQKGDVSNSANSRFLQEIGGDFWKSTDTAEGCAVVYVKLKWNSQIFNNVPSPFALMKGKSDIYDFRDASTGYTDNSALCIADYLLDPYIGVAATSSEFDGTAINTAANVADESVTTNDYYSITYPSAISGSSELDSRIHGYANVITSGTGRADRWITESTSSQYLDIQFSSAEQVEKISLTAPAELNAEEMPTGWVLKGSNTGAFSGEETVLDTVTGQSWESKEKKDFTFTNGSSYTYYRLDGLTVTARPNISIATIRLYRKVTSESRYTCNGTVDSSARIMDNIDLFTNSLAGSLTYVNGKYRVIAGKYQTPSITITEDEVLTEIGLSRPGRKDKFNAVKGVYINEEEGWVPTDFPHITNSTYETADGQRIYKDTDMSMTVSPAAAQRIAKIDLLRSRQDITVNVNVSLQKWDIAAGDTVMLTYSPFGWSSKVFDVIKRAFVLVDDVNGNKLFAIRLTLRETASTVYTWSQEETAVDEAPNTSLANPFNVYPLENLTLDSTETQLIRGQNGRIVTRIKASWSQHEDAFVRDSGAIELQYKKSSDSTYETANIIAGDRTFGFVTDVDDREQYDVRVRAINHIGGKSEWTTVSSHTVIGKTTPPPKVSGFEASEVLGVVRFKWDQVSILDVYGYEIRYGESGTQWKDGIPLTEAKQGTSEVSAAVPPGEWVFMIKAKDYVGLYSSVAAAAGPITVSNANSVLNLVDDGQFPGTLDNFVLHYTGVLVPDDQNLASFYDFETFDQFVPTPELICTYTSSEIDLGSDQNVRIWGDITSSLGPGVTTGVANPKLQVCYRSSADSSSGDEVVTNLVTSAGTFTNCILHYTGAIVPDSQSLANATSSFEVFDNFVYNPYENCTYEAPEQDLGADGNVILDIADAAALGPGQTGTPEHTISIDTRTSSGSYDGFEVFTSGTFNLRYYKTKIEWNNISNVSFIDSLQSEIGCWRDWIIGNVNNVRYIKSRIKLDTSVGNAKITDFNWTIDAP